MASLTSQSLDFVLQLKRNDRTKESLKKMGKFQVIDHPLIQHKLTIIRDKTAEQRFFVK